MSFIPLNGALCLQPWSAWRARCWRGFIPLNGALCLQPSRNMTRRTPSFIPLNGALCLQRVLCVHPVDRRRFIPLNGALCLQPIPSELIRHALFHSPKRGVMPATWPSTISGQDRSFHSPKAATPTRH